MNKKCKSYLISIIIPVYNLEKYVEKCFLSILNQSIGFHNLEIIFVDDCSTDNTYNILKEYTTNYSNVKLFQTDENSGVAGKPRNIGMKYATSDYIMFLDGDDEYYEDACEFLYDKIVESGSSIVSGTHTQLNTDNNKEEIPFSLLLNTFTDNNLEWNERINNLEQFNLEFPEEIMITDIQELPFIINNYKLASKIFNLKFLRDNKIIFPEFIIAEDSVFLYKSLVSAEKLIFNKKAIYKYNNTRNEENDKSVTFSDDMDLQISRLDAYGMIIDFGLENGLEDITVKYLINGKMAYFFNTFVLNKDLSCDILIEIFDRCKFLCALLLRDDVVLADNLRELYSLIVNDRYDDAVGFC
ncbi:glycosyltransferase family 2 protein [Methanosphaera sp. ISO3-F5]|uniref:glycosyltransferase family 2 protein n=1 Tax=Methanosphaera sp. ISO3-F5 TaxID=1452353 RepID=UPI002B259A4B|nr:glycosyltransferase family 2 protein [Methanosphaera sp. ISO3-F5]WQH63425.1 glycosyltransferase family 2 protein [Methanosphaera sp. ISO3-F5]